MTAGIGEVGPDSGDGPDVSCPCPDPSQFGSVWLPSPEDGLVYKIDADTMEIAGAYATAAEGGKPVTTAVSIDGHAVAVADEGGGLTKIWTRPGLCDGQQDTNPEVRTSTGPTALPFGTDECVAWSTPLPFSRQIPIGWGPGAIDAASCESTAQVVWTAGCTVSSANTRVVRVDGETGVVLGSLELDLFPCNGAMPTMGAVDRSGGFWLANSVAGASRLAKVDASGQLEAIEVPPLLPAGLTIDATGHVWLSSRYGSAQATAARLEPVTHTWSLAKNILATGRSGIVEDLDGRMWLAYERFHHVDEAPGVTWIDAGTMHVGAPASAGCPGGRCDGITMDFGGRVWSTSSHDARAYRYDPDAGEVKDIGGLRVSAYGSDPTGWSLRNAACAGP